MKQLTIIDTTLCREDNALGFKERIEILRQLERLNVDVIELPAIADEKTDSLFVRTASPFVKHAVLSVAAGTADGVKLAVAALKTAAKGQVRVELPVSPVGMEYTCHKKPDKMLAHIAATVSAAAASGLAVEFCAVDATRAEPDFLKAAVTAAVEAGAATVSVCDTAAQLMPDDFAAFTEGVAAYAKVPVWVRCEDNNGMACAAAMLAVRRGAEGVKVAVGGTTAALETVATVIKNCGNTYGLTAAIRQTELHRTVGQIAWITDKAKNAHTAVTMAVGDTGGIRLDAGDGQTEVIRAVAALGYDLSEEDQAHVYEEFLRVASKKAVGAKELEAIVASSALQVPATYKLVNYVVNNGNIISSTAQITLEREGKPAQGVSAGDGPIDAAFLAIDQILGHHYELDDFQIQSVTEGKEAMGSALVKLRAGGKLYAGTGISTDIIGASIRAYLNAVNKIVYEEA